MTTTSVTLTPRATTGTNYAGDRKYGDGVRAAASPTGITQAVWLNITRYQNTPRARLCIYGGNYSVNAYLNATDLLELAQACIDAAHDLEHADEVAA